MIFEDPTQKRWKRTKVIFAITLFFIATVLSFLTFSVITSPSLPSMPEKEPLQSVLKISRETIENEASSENAETSSEKDFSTDESDNSFDQLFPNKIISTAFLVQKDKDSYKSFKENSDKIDVVFPDWYFIKTDTCEVEEKKDQEITAGLKEYQVKIFPRVANGDNDIWYSEEIGSILQSPEKRNCLAKELARLAKNENVGGLNIDFEELNIANREPLLSFLTELTNLLHQQNQLLTIDVPAEDPTFDLKRISQIVDAVVLMSYDENYFQGKPGPIASQEWFEENLNKVLSFVPKEKLIVSLGSYGYDWNLGSENPAESLKFNETMYLAQIIKAEPEMSPVSKNMFVAYLDENKNDHRVWFLNGVTAYNQWLVAIRQQVLGFGLWRLGAEDPAFWNIWKNEQNFSQVPEISTVNFDLSGEMFYLKFPGQSGAMELFFDNDKKIDYAKYTTLPSGYVFERVGEEFSDKNIVLTFDDGPDPLWTPKILNVLEKFQVPAVFFVTGEQSQRNPSLLKEISSAGHLIGNHTYFHSDILNISDSRLKLEINETQRIIESTTGQKTILFRPPYNVDFSSGSKENLKNINEIDKLGYIFVNANVDSKDWETPGIDKIIENIVSGLSKNEGHIILLHDAGGDRSQTVAALEKLIPFLQSQDFNFVSLAEGSNLSSSILNPPLSFHEKVFVEINKFSRNLVHNGWTLITGLFLFTTIVAIARILFLGGLVLRSSTRKKQKTRSKNIPDFISVLIPAYNEETTIEKTLITLMKSRFKNFEVIVIDDGSTDKTAKIVKNLQKQDKRIRLISKHNAGKSSVLNLGFKKAKAEIVVTIDADTILLPNTLKEIIKPFADPTVSAVCGNVEVGNVKNILTGFQSLEYITSQNFDRRAFDEINGISVVPGATGAWRKDKILAIGGYLDDTLTEDADLTLRLLAIGEKIVYAPKARSKTEAPETVSGLLKQRFRWSFGTFQCLSKNRKLFFKGSLGWVALPNIFFFQVLFPVLSPVGDLVLIFSIIMGNWSAVLGGYIIFTLIDVSASLLAFSLEKKPKKLMWLILIQRFFYRQFMYIITYRSLLAVLKGKKHGWNKLQRTGNVYI
ncbi:MAG: glycosyltransferase [bacterium]